MEMVSIVPACSPGKVGNDMSLRDRFSPSPCGGEGRYRQLVATTFWRDRSTRAHSALDCTCPWIICSSSNNKGANQPKVKTMAIPTFAQTQIRRQYSGVASTKHGRGEAVARTRRRQQRQAASDGPSRFTSSTDSLQSPQATPPAKGRTHGRGT